ncbi:amidohydrolase [Aestuariivirga sp.]|uniref:amidohydrolase family protein n=1 Tax=Aestuariivirga sp. TaxID=2650926 RepID=UPI0035942EDB
MIDFPIVDTHVHLLDTKKFKYSWAAGAPKLGRDWSADDLTALARPYTIESLVFVEVDVDMPQYLDEAEWVQSMSEKDTRIKGCVACLPMERGAALEPEMERLSKLDVVRGVRRLIQNQPDPDFVLKPDFLSAIKLLPKYNLSFDICIFHHQLPNTLELVRRCPDVSFVLDHIAKPGIKAGLMEPWAANIREMASLPNVVCKLSGVTTEAAHESWTREQLRPYIDHVIESFGFNRIMYGGDWPVSELAGRYPDWLEVLDWATAGCTPEEKRKLFRDNGIAAYRLA